MINMLKVSNLTKTYQPKKGPKVQALRGIDIEFPQIGMVFILGKSGSGKSTLLNILSGLDKADRGEISYGGKSFKDFSPSDFDSYRNTYCGFIFQEYNLLPELSVEDNLALSIQLLGRKLSKYEIENALKAVDLQGYEKRQVNELSGGEKQRITIARGIIKQPKIIFADEPTGALDNKTGRQVLDMLKLQSRDKLVVVVSHDAEFANNYADRIIELADGKIISDTDNSIKYDTANKSESKTNINGNKQDKKTSNLEQYQAIKSKLPLKAALKLGISSFKHRPFRLAITILLSAVAFTMFGLSIALASFDTKDTIAKSLFDSKSEYAHFRKVISTEGYEQMAKFTDDEIQNLSKELDSLCLPVLDEGFSLDEYFVNIDAVDWEFFADSINGITTLSDDKSDIFEIVGSLPKDNNQIAITNYVAQSLLASEFAGSEARPEDLLGLKLDIFGEKSICGIVDTGFDMDRYQILKNFPKNTYSSFGGELSLLQSISFHCLAFVNELPFSPDEFGGLYDAIVAITSDKSLSGYKTILAVDGKEQGGVKFVFYNHIKSAVESMSVTLTKVKNFALYISVFFAGFAAIMLINFISLSVMQKQNLLGVLRAMGAQKADAYKIFTLESLVIGITSFVLAAVAIYLAGYFINRYFRLGFNILLSVISVPISTIIIVFGLSVIISLLGSIVSIALLARKTPIDLIKSL